MPIDDRMRRAAADARAAVARTRHEPIGTVRRRAAMQRIMAFGLGAIVVLAGVGAVAIAGGSVNKGDALFYRCAQNAI